MIVRPTATSAPVRSTLNERATLGFMGCLSWLRYYVAVRTKVSLVKRHIAVNYITSISNMSTLVQVSLLIARINFTCIIKVMYTLDYK